MKLIITIFLIVGLVLSLTYASFNRSYFEKLLNKENVKIDDTNTKETEEIKVTETIPTPKAFETVSNVKELPNWLKKYQDTPKNEHYSLLKKILKDNSIFPEENMYAKVPDIADNFQIFSGVYQTNAYKNALELIDLGYGEIVYKNLDKFEILDAKKQEEIINISKKRNEYFYIAQNFKFIKLSQNREIEIANEILEQHPNDLIEHFNYFKQIPKSYHSKYANSILEKDKFLLKEYNYWGNNTCLLFSNIEKFDGLTEKQKIDLFNRSYDNKFECGREVAANFDKFNIQNKSAKLDIAAKIIMDGLGGFITLYIQKFNFSSEEQLIIAQRIIDQKQNVDSLQEDINNFNSDIRTTILNKIK
jgi:hypothetical protein